MVGLQRLGWFGPKRSRRLVPFRPAKQSVSPTLGRSNTPADLRYVMPRCGKAQAKTAPHNQYVSWTAACVGHYASDVQGANCDRSIPDASFRVGGYAGMNMHGRETRTPIEISGLCCLSSFPYAGLSDPFTTQTDRFRPLRCLSVSVMP